jgi:gamma-glutamyl-gamma-aminobutyrate hydrolase PuuD
VVSSASERRPRIGLTMYLEVARWGTWERTAALVPEVYLDGVTAAGGTPVLLPPVATDTAVVDILDGLVVIGGADIEPSTYGADAHPQTRSHPERDAHEAELLRAAMAKQMPVLGLCRGAQLINVVLGGSLHQHLPDVVGHDDHRPGPSLFGTSSVSIEPGSRLSGIVGTEVKVPCYHHQALDRIASGLRVTATAADGTVEALESTGAGWMVGVQWHPEEDVHDVRLLRAHVQAAREYAERQNEAQEQR